MINKIKTYTIAILALISGIFTALFFYEKRKANTASSLLQNEKVEEQVQKENEQIQTNNQSLQAEVEKRKEIENAPQDSAYNLVKFFNNNK